MIPEVADQLIHTRLSSSPGSVMLHRAGETLAGLAPDWSRAPCQGCNDDGGKCPQAMACDMQRRPMRLSRFVRTVPVVVLLFDATPAGAIDQPPTTPLSAMPAHSGQGMPAREAYTADHQILVRLLSVPSPIPMEKYFSLQLAIYDGNDPLRQLPDAQVQVTAAMSHGMAQGFAHGMQSSPRVAIHDGIATVSGMFFHMSGDWTLQVSVHANDRSGTVSFNLPCCEQ